ncbi:MAG: helix-turn-helix transcriptional regulator [Victivallaceae bacterium]
MKSDNPRALPRDAADVAGPGAYEIYRFRSESWPSPHLASQMLWPRTFIASERRRAHWYRHRHYPYVAVEMVLSGQMFYKEGDEKDKTEVRGDELYLIGRGSDCTLSTLPESRPEKLVLELDGTLLDQALVRAGLHDVRKITLPEPEIVARQMRLIGDLLAAAVPGSESAISGGCLGLLIKLGEIVRDRRPRPELLNRAVEKIRRSAGCVLAVGELAAELNTSAATLTRLFQTHFGMAPHRYMSKLRMEAARELLQYSELPVKAIAARLGYANQLYFATDFRRRTGISPNRFRKGSCISEKRSLY